jgi:predicted TIM-barrel fold metal-dependent hydrolase
MDVYTCKECHLNPGFFLIILEYFMEIFDVHGHFWAREMGGSRYMDPEAEKWFSSFFLGTQSVLEADAEKLIEALDTAEENIGYPYRMCVFALDLGYKYRMDIPIAKLNNWVVSQAEKDTRGRIIPFACIDPRRKEALKEARRCALDLGVKGFKLYPPTGFYPDDKEIFQFYEEIIKLQQESNRKLPLLFHQGFCISGSKYARPIFMEETAFRFKPDLKIIMAHAGIPWVDEALSLAALNTNVYLDISLFGDLYGFWPQLHMQLFGKAKRAGVLDRILFGSDWPLCSAWMKADIGAPSWSVLHKTIQALAKMRMPGPLTEMGYPEIMESEIAGILGSNARELFPGV